jgi:hypothetical protein
MEKQMWFKSEQREELNSHLLLNQVLFCQKRSKLLQEKRGRKGEKILE